MSSVEVQARLTAVAQQQRFPTPDSARSPLRVGVDPVQRELGYAFGKEFRTVAAAAAVVLLLGCVNVSGLALGRRRQRSREMAMRRALGASDWQLARVALSEALPLGLAGTVAGIALASAVVRVIVSVMPAYIVLVKTPAIDWRVLGFAAIALTLTVVLPMVVERGARTPALPSLIADGGSTTPRRAWASGAIAAVQVALAFALAVGGTFLVSSFYWAWRQDPGYSRDRIAIVEFGIQSTEADDLLRRADELRRVAREIPGVEAVAMEGQAFMRGSALRPAIQRPAGAARGREEAIPVTAEFFELLGFAPLRGRLFTAAEVAAGERVAVLSERAAKALWPGDDAVGKVLRSANGRVTTTVIGVVRDARYAVLERADYGQIYTPFFPFTRSTLFLKHGGDAGDTLRDAVARARAIPGVGVLRAATMREALGESVRLREFRAWVFGGFAFAALGVMAIGVFGLAAMSTARRTREIGLRIALGATRPRIVTSLIREHAPAVAVGLLAGGLLTWWGMQFLKSYLYQFTGQDVRIWALAMTAVVAVVLGGVAIPAVRSSRLDPLLTLRAE
jgi:putative ABC transport system permease protein